MKTSTILSATVCLVASLTGTARSQVISEIRIEDPSFPDTEEYFELFGTPATDLSDLTYIVIGDGAGGQGVLEVVVSLAGQSIPADGYFLAAEPSLTLAGGVDLTLTVAPGLAFEGADNVTHLLVQGFTGSDNTDLDTNDDGTLDSEPWSAIVDCVALMDQVVGGDLTYCATRVGPNSGSVPSHVYLDGTWQMGAFDPAASNDTPGSENATLPVELASFEARVDGERVNLYWSTASESNSAGFMIEHRRGSEYRELAFVEGRGDTRQRMDYAHTVSNLGSGRHAFRLRQIDLSGTFSYSDEVEVNLESYESYRLSSAFPNPFNPTTSIELSVREAQRVTADVFNMLGQRVATLFRGTLEAGEITELRFVADHLPTGIYTIRIAGSSFIDSRHVVLMK
jgi:hypothetical protein